MSTSALDAVDTFWKLMAGNDFAAVGQVLSDDFRCEWPMTNELILGRENFARMNAEYPANGPWRFTVNRSVASGDEVVTDVTVTDGTVVARAISFFTVHEGRICRVVEFWPEPAEAPANRRHLVEPLAAR